MQQLSLKDLQIYSLFSQMGNTSSQGQPCMYNDREFMLLGKTGIGKSTFGNLLIGGEYNSFKTSTEMSSYSYTRAVKSVVTTLSPGTLSCMGFKDQNSTIRVKVIDQPGMDDAEFKLNAHCNNLIKCMESLDTRALATFLIVVNLKLDRLSDDRCLLLTQLSELLRQASYPFFSRAVIVFTHADGVVGDINNKAELMQVVRRKIQDLRGWEEMEEILLAVNGRCIFVNGTSRDESYRYQILEELFELSKSTLTMRFYGNNDFTYQYLRDRLCVRRCGILQDVFYNLDFQFQPDIDLFSRGEFRRENKEFAYNELLKRGLGVSAKGILISLIHPFSTQMEQLILDLPACCIPGHSLSLKYFVKRWWKHAFVVFKVANETDAEIFVRTNINRNPRIKSIVDKVSNRWTWIAEDTTTRLCRDRITELCLAVRKRITGSLHYTVNYDLRDKMIEYKESKGETSEVGQFTQEFHDAMAKGALTIMESENYAYVKLGGIPINCHILVSSVRLILKHTCLSDEQIKRFRDKYPNPNDEVYIGGVLHFLAN